MSLYLKYRPRKIEELDLAGVRETLGGMIKSNKLAHAYLFTGPRGAGKTSASRILARVVNCEKNGEKIGEPCNECEACLSILGGSAVDVVEIDAASNRGIDDIRELKERIKLAPAILRKKVYIIDEVHMLTTEAFNALLKTLEEPPSHAVFILCTTEAHKVPETIVSRCVRVIFTKATPEEMVRSFTRVIKGEKAEMDDDAIELLARSVDGSFRDGVKILDTVLSSGKRVQLADVEKVMYGAEKASGKSLAENLAKKDLNTALENFRTAMSEGVDLIYLLTSCMKELRAKIVEEGMTQLIPLVFQLDDTARKAGLSPVPELLAEITIVGWCEGVANPNPPERKDGNSKQAAKEPAVTVKQPVPQAAASAATEPEITMETQEPEKSEPLISIDPGNKFEDEIREQEQVIVGMDANEAWRRLTQFLSSESYSLGALLSKARPGNIHGNVLTIEMKHEFHKEQLLQEKFRRKVEDLVSKAVGQRMRIDCVVAKSFANDQPRETLQSAPQVDTISQVDPEENELLQAAEEIFS